MKVTGRRSLLADAAARRLGQASTRAPRFLDPAFPAQTAFISDPAKLKVVLCTRRSGKSYGGGLYLYQQAYETPGASCLYIALTRDSAKKIMWKDVLKPINRKLGLGTRFNETELTATLPNGSVIYVLGVDSTEEEKQKLLGQKYKLVAIDEAASFSIDLNELVYGVLKPAVTDYRGTICLIGMPGNLKKGLFFELTQGQDPGSAGTWSKMGWSGHRWPALDNPYIRENWLQEIAELKVANPRIEETPLFQQHYRGRWVIDDSRLVYRYQPGRNDFGGQLPRHTAGQWRYVLGVDLGYTDPTALSLCAYHDHDKTLYVLEAEKFVHLDVTEVAQKIRGYQARYELDTIVIDNANKQAVQELQRRHDLPLRAADKTGKSDFIEIMNGEFIQERIKLNPEKCSQLADEYAGLIWDERSAKREEHPNCPDHLTDATLYAWRYCYAYLSEIPPPKPQPYTKEWHDQEEKEMEEAEVERYLALEAERSEAEEWGYGWEGPRPEPISWRSFTRRNSRS